MKTTIKLLVIAALILGGTLVISSTPAAAQAPTIKTVIVTEAQVNNWYRFTNPIRRSVTSLVADFQPGQVVITSTAKYRDNKTLVIVTTLVPSVSNGRLYWSVTNATANDKSASPSLISQINAQITTSWLYYFKSKAPTGHITGIQITDSEADITVQPR